MIECDNVTKSKCDIVNDREMINQLSPLNEQKIKSLYLYSMDKDLDNY